MSELTIKWDFTCKACPRYEKAERGKMGFCRFHKKKVAKTYGCRDNPLIAAFWLSLIPPKEAE